MILSPKDENVNRHDLDNILFILNLDPDEISQWLNTLSVDDMRYALEIIQSRTAEMIVEEMDLDDQEEMDLTQGNALINRIKSEV
jgi:hypothetical protein